LGFTSSTGQFRWRAAYSLVPPSPTADKIDLRKGQIRGELGVNQSASQKHSSAAHVSYGRT
jgi:hypothetical protein